MCFTTTSVHIATKNKITERQYMKGGLTDYPGGVRYPKKHYHGLKANFPSAISEVPFKAQVIGKGGLEGEM